MPTAAGKSSISERPRPIDLIVGRSTGLGSALFAPVYWPAAPVVNFLDYFYHAHRHDLADEAGPETPPAYFHWRRSMAAIDLLDLEQTSLGWTPTAGSAICFRPSIATSSSSCTMASTPGAFADRRGTRPASGRDRSPAGSSPTKRGSSASWPDRSIDFAGSIGSWPLPTRCFRLEPTCLCVVVGDPIVRRGLDVEFHNRDYPAHLMASSPVSMPIGSGSWGLRRPHVVAEVLAASDLHIAPSRSYPGRPLVARGDGGGLRRRGLRHGSAPRSDRAGTNRSSGRRSRCGRPGAAGAGRARGPGRIPAAGGCRGGAGARALFPGCLSAAACRAVHALWLPPGGTGRERSVHPRRVPRAVRPARPRADQAPRLAVQLPGAESFELPDPLARDARRRSSCTGCRWRPSIARATAFPGRRFTDTTSSNAGRCTTRCAPSRACAPT